MLDREKGDVHSGDHLGRWRRLCVRIDLIALAASSGERCAQHHRQQYKWHSFAFHDDSRTPLCLSTIRTPGYLQIALAVRNMAGLEALRALRLGARKHL